MSRKVIALSEDIKNSESLFNIKGWQPSKTSQGGNRQKKRSQNLNNNPKKEVESNAESSLKWKTRKTIREQKKLAKLREWRMLETVKLSRGLKVEDTLNQEETEGKENSSPERTSDSKLNSRTNSGTSNRSVNSLKKEISPSTKTSAENLNHVDQEIIEELAETEENEVKRYRKIKCGGKVYQQICDDNCDDEPTTKGERNCDRQFKLRNKSLKIFAPRRSRISIEMTLGKPYGIQLGSLSIDSEYFDDNIRGRQAFDSLLVAHGVSFFKNAFDWTQRDIDEIVVCGSELYEATKEVSIDRMSQITKAFTFKNQFIQVTISEPVVVGKLMTVRERSLDLLIGLEKFFSQHSQGILQTPDLDLYISYCKAFVVFDPRGRSLNCHKCRTGEAALMLFGQLENVYHLILNLSKINVNGPFKISSIAITQIINSEHSPDKFLVVNGNPMKICRTDDFKVLNDYVAHLKGNLSLKSKVFETINSKQHLTTAIMAAIYAKIDPPNTWTRTILDRVLHFGAKFFSDIIKSDAVKNLTLADIPSKLYVGELYRVGIMIVPFLKRSTLQSSRSLCDNQIAKDIREVFESSSFRCFLLQVGNSTFTAWQVLSSEVFYFFDSEQKDEDGKSDWYEGSSSLFMVGTIEKLCDLIVKRLTQNEVPSSKLDIHGLKLIEVKKLSEREQKCKPTFKLKKKNCIKPMTPEDANAFHDSPSTVDSVAPLLTAHQIRKLRDKVPEKPLHRQVSNLNSPSLVCCKTRVYEELMREVEETSSSDMRTDFPPETVEIVQSVNSEILAKATEEKK